MLFVRSQRWTGGRQLRRLIRSDLAGNVALVHVVQVRDAIAVEEREDEGPTFLIKAASGETLVFAGQYLSRHAARGFPWTEFEIRGSFDPAR